MYETSMTMHIETNDDDELSNISEDEQIKILLPQFNNTNNNRIHK